MTIRRPSPACTSVGELYAEAIRDTCVASASLCVRFAMRIARPDHLPRRRPVNYLGRVVQHYANRDASSCERTAYADSNFREPKFAAGGRGAPLSLWSITCCSATALGRVALNIGDREYHLFRQRQPENIVAFEQVRNMVIDALVSRLTDAGRPATAMAVSHANPDSRRLAESDVGDPYFKLRPPRTAGREQFGQEYSSGLIATASRCRPDSHCHELTARSIASAISSYAKTTRESSPPVVEYTPMADATPARTATWSWCRHHRRSGIDPTPRRLSPSPYWLTNSSRAAPATCRRPPEPAGPLCLARNARSLKRSLVQII